MARIIYSALVESIRGSIQGTTFQRSAYGYTAKAKPKMVNPNRFKQAGRKQSFSVQARKWRALTEPNRAAWGAYAEAFPIPSRLNPDSYLNAFNLFAKYHNLFNQLNNSATLADPGTTQASVEFLDPDIFVDGDDLIFEGTLTFDEGDWQAYVYCTNPIPYGQEFIKTTPRCLGSGAANPSFSINIASRFIDQFGALPVVGDWLGVRMVYIRTDAGQFIEVPAVQIQLQAV